MGKRAVKVTADFIPLPGETSQGLLFADARTKLQQMILDAADGSRNVEAIAHECGISREDCEKAINTFLIDGDLRPATAADIFRIIEDAPAAENPEKTLQLIRYGLLLDPGSLPLNQHLAMLYEKTARSHEACDIYRKLSEAFQQQGRLGEALEAARNAARLQPGNWDIQNELAMICVLTGRPEEAARVWRGYARRLCGSGHYEDALAIIDQASKQLPGNDILLFAEAEILSAMPTQYEIESQPLTENSQTPQKEQGSVNQPSEPEQTQTQESAIAPTSTTAEVAPPLEDMSPTTENSANTERVNPYIEKLVPRKEEQETPPTSRARKRMNYAGYIAALLILLSIIVAAYDFQSRQAMRHAAGNAEKELIATADAPLYRKLERAKAIREKLQASRSFITIFETQEFDQQLQRTDDFIQQISKLLATHRQDQKDILDQWKKKTTPQNIAPLYNLAQSEDIFSPYVIEASKLYKEWLKKKQQNEKQRREQLDALNNLSLSVDERFKAYHTLWGISPEIFSRPFPLGASDLSLPVHLQLSVTAKLQENSAIPAGFDTLLDGKKMEQQDFPLSLSSDIKLYHPGYRIDSQQEPPACYSTPLPKPYNQQIRYTASRVNRWKTELPFEAKAIKFIHSGAETSLMVCGDKTALSIKQETGEVLHTFSAIAQAPESKPEESGVTASVNPQLDSVGKWCGFLDSTGHAAFFQNAQTYYATNELFIHDIEMFTPSMSRNPCALLWSSVRQKNSSGGILRCVQLPQQNQPLNVLWEYPSQSSHEDSIGTPGGTVLWHKGYVLAADLEGRIHVLLENGELLAVLNFPEFDEATAADTQILLAPVRSIDGNQPSVQPQVLAICTGKTEKKIIRIKLSLKPTLKLLTTLPPTSSVIGLRAYHKKVEEQDQIFLACDDGRLWSIRKVSNEETMYEKISLPHKKGMIPHIGSTLVDFFTLKKERAAKLQALATLQANTPRLSVAEIDLISAPLNKLVYANGRTLFLWEFLKTPSAP